MIEGGRGRARKRDKYPLDGDERLRDIGACVCTGRAARRGKIYAN